jgi:hypothetical protein
MLLANHNRASAREPGRAADAGRCQETAKPAFSWRDQLAPEELHPELAEFGRPTRDRPSNLRPMRPDQPRRHPALSILFMTAG